MIRPTDTNIPVDWRSSSSSWWIELLRHQQMSHETQVGQDPLQKIRKG
jgi:hypothetical protein